MKNKLVTTKEVSKNLLFVKEKKGEYIRVARGIYSSDSFYKPLEVYSLRYPNGIFTMQTLFSIYKMTDRFIDKYHISTKRGSRTIIDSNIIQSRQNPEIFEIGKEKIEYNGIYINVYNKERLLIELFRKSNKLPRRLYKDVINYYRNYLHEGFRVHIFQAYCDKFMRDTNILREKFRREIQ